MEAAAKYLVCFFLDYLKESQTKNHFGPANLESLAMYPDVSNTENYLMVEVLKTMLPSLSYY